MYLRAFGLLLINRLEKPANGSCLREQIIEVVKELKGYHWRCTDWVACHFSRILYPVHMARRTTHAMVMFFANSRLKDLQPW